MLEDGEISDSSVESCHSIDLPSSTTHPKYAPGRTSTGRPSMQDTERSYIQMHLMDVEPDSGGMNVVESATKPKRMKGQAAADLWKQQLLKENEEKQSASSRTSIKKVVIVDPKQAIQPMQKAKKAVFINHRRLEKRDLGQFVKSPPKPVEIKPKQNEVTGYAQAIAASLKENRKDVIQKVVDACGIQKCSELCTEAQLIYSTTGMLTIDGTPRTLGGCFFQLVKSKGDLSESQRREIFYEPTTKLSLHKKQVRNAKKKLKKKKNTQEQLESIFASMNLNINVTVR